MTHLTEEDCMEIFRDSATLTIFLGVVPGGFVLKWSLFLLGFQNNGDMAIPVIVYCIALIIVAIFIVPKYAIKWCAEDQGKEVQQ